MARTIELRDTGRVVVAEPPVILEPPQTPITTPRKTSRRGFLKGSAFAAGGLGIGAVLHQTGVIRTGLNWANKFFEERDANIQRREALATRSLEPQAGESASWWMELPEQRIRELAQLPEIHQIGERFASTVSPDLQAKAQQAGYGLIYQGNPEDSVGRTVITKGRHVDKKDWSVEDLGFGRAGLDVRGIFKAWVPDPTDPNQKEKVYALLYNPIKPDQKYLVAVQLFPFDPNNFSIRPTWFDITNLDYGPRVNNPSSVQNKKLTDFPTFNELLREKGLELTDLIEPGDYVRTIMQTAGVDDQTGKNRYKQDNYGVSRSLEIVVRRFGGSPQWQSEVQR